MDVGVEGAAVGQEAVRPQQVDQLVTGPDPPARGQQHGQQVEFAPRQVGHHAVDGDLPAHEVTEHRPEPGVGAEFLLRLGAGRHAPGDRRDRGWHPGGDPSQDGVHPRHQLPEVEGLGHVAGGAELQAEDDVELGVDGTDHDDGDRGDGPHATADLDPVHAREEEVEQDDVGSVLAELAERVGAVGRRGHLEALVAEARGQRPAVGLLVLHHEHVDAVVNGVHGWG